MQLCAVFPRKRRTFPVSFILHLNSGLLGSCSLSLAKQSLPHVTEAGIKLEVSSWAAVRAIMHPRESSKLAAHSAQAETSHGAPAQGSLFNLEDKQSAPARLPVYRYALHLRGPRRKGEHVRIFLFL